MYDIEIKYFHETAFIPVEYKVSWLKPNFLLQSIGLYHPLDGITNPMYKLLLTSSNILSKRKH